MIDYFHVGKKPATFMLAKFLQFSISSSALWIFFSQSNLDISAVSICWVHVANKAKGLKYRSYGC